MCREDAFLGVAAFLVGNLPLVELGFVAVGDLPHIGEEYVEPFLFGEDRGAVTADASAQDCDAFHLLCLSFQSKNIPEQAALGPRTWQMRMRTEPEASNVTYLPSP